MFDNTQLWWFVARSGGIVAWALLAASVLWGLALSTKITNGRPRPNWILDLHRYLGGLAVVFTAIHVAALVLDTYVSFGLSEILVPYTSSYRPSAVALGIVGMYLLAAVEITSLLRKRLSKGVWRAVHFFSFPLFFFSTAHGILAGTDGTGRPLLYSMLAVSVAVIGLTVARIDQAMRPAPSSPRIPAKATTAAGDRTTATTTAKTATNPRIPASLRTPSAPTSRTPAGRSHR